MTVREREKRLRQAIDEMARAEEKLREAILSVKMSIAQFGHTAELEVISDMLTDRRQEILHRFEAGGYEYYLNQGSIHDEQEKDRKEENPREAS